MLLDDKVVIVTGAAAGIGRATAEVAAKAGARVCLLDRDIAAGDAAAAAIPGAMFVACDVSEEAQIEAAIDAVMARHGRLDGACNNAGIEMANKMLPDLGTDDWHRLMAINLTGVFLCMKYQTRAMAGTGGAIVNISSGDGIIGQPYAADYVASKHGVIGLTRAASCEARMTRVRVNAVLPGLILTPMVKDRLFANPAFASQLGPMEERHSIGRFGEPEDVGEAVVWLLSDRSAFVNGAALTVDGGYTAR